MKKLICILIISCFISCKTNHDTTLTGEVIDQTTRNPISNVNVFLVGSTTSLGGNPGYTELQNVTTGVDGKYTLNFKRDGYDHYYVVAKPFEPYKYYSNPSTNDLLPISFSKTTGKETVTKDIELLHCGYIKVNFHHTSADTIVKLFAGSNQGHYLYTNYGAIFNNYTPNFIDNTTYVFCLEGNKTNIIYLESDKKLLDGTTNIDTIIEQSYYTVPHDTIYYQFNY